MAEIEGDGVVKSEGVGVQQEASPTPSTPTQCPIATCRSKELAKLNQRAGMQLWQCGKCLNEWSTPLSQAERSAALLRLAHPSAEVRPDELCVKGCGEGFRFPPEKTRHEAGCHGRRKAKAAQEAEEKTVTLITSLKCRKGCAKEFVHPKRRENHEAKCKGAGPGRGNKPAVGAAKRFAEIRSKRAPANPSAPSDPVSAALEALRDKRDELIAAHPEIRRVDAAIAALELIEKEAGA